MTANNSSLGRIFLFDVGGVLIIWRDEWAFRSIGRRLKVPYPLVEQTFLPLRERLQLGEIGLKEFWEEFAAMVKIPVPGDWSTLWGQELSRRGRGNAAVRDIVRRLREKGHRTGVFSNTDASHVKIFKEKNWLPGFERWILSYQLGATKPNPLVFQRAEKALGLAGKDIVLIDDRRSNVEGALSQGWDALLYRNAPDLTGQLKRRAFL
jgi:putative hydrolase of the HAD superfamily